MALLLLAGCAAAAPPPAPAPPAPAPVAAAGPRPWPVPDGWGEETIPFPLAFSPSLPYRGIEYLRFAPGFFEPDADGYWSYAFVWILEDAPAVTSDALERDLDTYFRGLMLAIADGKRDVPADAIRVSLAASERDAGQRGSTFTGRIDLLAAFTSWEPISLAARGELWPCGQQTIVLFAASPQPFGHQIWKQLGDLLAAFQCSR